MEMGKFFVQFFGLILKNLKHNKIISLKEVIVKEKSVW
jgi:hypothetical protein